MYSTYDPVLDIRSLVEQCLAIPKTLVAKFCYWCTAFARQGGRTGNILNYMNGFIPRVNPYVSMGSLSLRDLLEIKDVSLDRRQQCLPNLIVGQRSDCCTYTQFSTNVSL